MNSCFCASRVERKRHMAASSKTALFQVDNIEATFGLDSGCTNTSLEHTAYDKEVVGSSSIGR